MNSFEEPKDSEDRFPLFWPQNISIEMSCDICVVEPLVNNLNIVGSSDILSLAVRGQNASGRLDLSKSCSHSRYRAYSEVTRVKVKGNFSLICSDWPQYSSCRVWLYHWFLKSWKYNVTLLPWMHVASDGVQLEVMSKMLFLALQGKLTTYFCHLCHVKWTLKHDEHALLSKTKCLMFVCDNCCHCICCNRAEGEDFVSKRAFLSNCPNSFFHFKINVFIWYQCQNGFRTVITSMLESF